MTTITPEGRMVTGLFNDRDTAERAYQSLSARGYNKDDVNLVSPRTRARSISPRSRVPGLNLVPKPRRAPGWAARSEARSVRSWAPSPRSVRQSLFPALGWSSRGRWQRRSRGQARAA